MTRMTRSALLEMSFQLSELRDRRTYLISARTLLSELLPCDDVFWFEADFRTQSSLAIHGPDVRPNVVLGGVVLEAAADHPVVQSYLRNPRDLVPRRISDVSTKSEWRRSQALALLSPYMGPFELSVVTCLEPGPAGSTWTVNRVGHDFTDDEVELASQIQPVLVALDRLYRPRSPDRAGPAQSVRLAPVGAADLTERELDILGLVALGLKADAIGRLRRISPRTVRKHLENAYGKLGAHDRLMAVTRARQLGLLADVAPRYEPAEHSVVHSSGAEI
jgi:DNA-binding CsgD family transcriptional regulator